MHNTPTSETRASLIDRATPVFRVSTIDTPLGELWVKNDGLTNPLYGGNKVRKLELILRDALRRHARRVVTVGAAGSHHALATAVFARSLGLDAAAVLCQQPSTLHAQQTLADALAFGLHVCPARSVAQIPLKLAGLLRRHDYFVPPGGSNRLGTLGYVSAMGELAQQIQRRELPCPDVIVVPVGSGGTAAGLLAGALREALPIRIIGVRVGGYAPLTRPLVLLLAARALEMFGNAAAAARLSRGLELVHDYVGRGYGFGTREAEIACSVAAGFNLELDLTYTAKAFAKALGLVGQAAIESERRTGHPLQRVGSAERPLRVLYWHTLSAVRPIASANSTSFTLPHALSDLFMRAAV